MSAIRHLAIRPFHGDAVFLGNPRSTGNIPFNQFGVPAYRSGDRCGFCGGSGWHVGRVIAECSNPRCGNAVMLDHP